MKRQSDNRRWIDETLSALVLDNPTNKLTDFGGAAIFDRPLIAVADGRDPWFDRLAVAVTPRHLMPAPFLKTHSDDGADLAQVRVVSWALPFSQAVCQSNRAESEWPSRMYSLARNNGGALMHEVACRLVERLRNAGWAAAAPVTTDAYDAFRGEAHPFASTWSERHVACIAGLGQFGLTGALITPRGSFVRLGSVVTNLPLEPTPRSYDDYRAPCLQDGGRSCGLCIERCPAGAISSEGMNREACYRMRRAVRDRFMESYTTSLEMRPAPIVKNGKREAGYSLGCALCQCGVPCQDRTPPFANAGSETTTHARY